MTCTYIAIVPKGVINVKNPFSWSSHRFVFESQNKKLLQKLCDSPLPQSLLGYSGVRTREEKNITKETWLKNKTIEMDLLNRINAHWRDLLDNKPDPRVSHLPLMASPFPTIVICLSYVYIVKVSFPFTLSTRQQPFTHYDRCWDLV